MPNAIIHYIILRYVKVHYLMFNHIASCYIMSHCYICQCHEIQQYYTNNLGINFQLNAEIIGHPLGEKSKQSKPEGTPDKSKYTGKLIAIA